MLSRTMTDQISDCLVHVPSTITSEQCDIVSEFIFEDLQYKRNTDPNA